MELDQDRYIMVTGGAGFIGSGLIRHLNDHGFSQIVVFDEFDESEKWKNLVGKSFVDALDKEEAFPWLDAHPGEVQAIVHLGACSSTVEQNSGYLLNNNTHFSQALCDAALETDIRFIYASSAATYGDGALGFSDVHKDLQRYRPLNMYGYSKHLFDLWLERQGLLEEVVGLKYFNVFGPNESHKGRMASAIFHLLPQIQKEGKVRLFQSSEPERFADGEQCRDFIYVKDAVRMTAAFLDPECKERGIFNIGRGKPGTWNEMARALFRALELPEQIEYIPMPEDLHGKYQNYTCADMGKHEQSSTLDGSSTELSDAVIEYVRDYLLKDERW